MARKTFDVSEFKDYMNSKLVLDLSDDEKYGLITMTSQEKLDYIYLTLKSFHELLPKTENVVLDVNDDKIHQLSARTLISLDFATSILS